MFVMYFASLHDTSSRATPGRVPASKPASGSHETSCNVPSGSTWNELAISAGAASAHAARAERSVAVSSTPVPANVADTHCVAPRATAVTALVIMLWLLRRGVEGYVKNATASVFTLVYVPFLASFVALLLGA